MADKQRTYTLEDVISEIPELSNETARKRFAKLVAFVGTDAPLVKDASGHYVFSEDDKEIFKGYIRQMDNGFIKATMKPSGISPRGNNMTAERLAYCESMMQSIDILPDSPLRTYIETSIKEINASSRQEHMAELLAKMADVRERFYRLNIPGEEVATIIYSANARLEKWLQNQIAERGERSRNQNG